MCFNLHTITCIYLWLFCRFLDHKLFLIGKQSNLWNIIVVMFCLFVVLKEKKNKDSSYAQQLILDANFFAQLVNSNINYIVCGQFLILGPICFCGQGSVEPEFWWLCNQDDHHTCFPSPFTRDKDAQYTSRSELTCSAENCKLAKCHFQMPQRQVIVLLANSVFSTWNVKSRVAPLYCYCCISWSSK